MTTERGSKAIRSGPRRGFSLPELVMVLSITTVLAGLLFPVLSEARERADRVISANNLRSIGLAVTMFDSDFRSLPTSSLLEEDRSPSELTLLFRADRAGEMLDRVPVTGWDGLGQLWHWGYIDAPKTFYAPHLINSHGHDQIEFEFWGAGEKPLHGDYHYGGHLEWDTGLRRNLAQKNLVIAADTLRRVTELNHEDGMNLVRSDGSVEWIAFPPSVLENLARPEETPQEVKARYLRMWREIEGVD